MKIKDEMGKGKKDKLEFCFAEKDECKSISEEVKRLLEKEPSEKTNEIIRSLRKRYFEIMRKKKTHNPPSNE